jgi:hypothetical protein
MNYYTVGKGLNEKLVTVEDDIESLVTSNGTLEDDVEALVTATTALTTAYTPTPTDVTRVDQALTVSGETATATLTITDVACTGARIVAIQVVNKGASTSVKVNVYGEIGSIGYTTVPEITEVTLNATTTTSDIITLLSGYPIVPYDKVKVVIANADAANATTVDATVRVII